MRQLRLTLLLALTLLMGTAPPPGSVEGKICGVSLVAPPRKVDATWTQPVKQISAEWVAIMPYAYSRMGEPEVHWDSHHQWWGETEAGARETVKHARQAGLNVMMKPMVWVPGGWPGGFELTSEADWQKWEASYERYVLRLAVVAAEEGAQAFCIGTEFKLSATQRPQFWSGLAAKVRAVFPGKVTYAANWDEFTQITFWGDLDYIGVDAYFPLSDATVPDYAALGRAWKTANTAMEKLSRQYGRKVLFTEFGYRSVDKTAWKQWELEEIGFGSKVNHKAQTVSYRALFENVWHQDWFAGGFLWQWYTHDEEAGGQDNSDYTPQNKPAESLVKEWYSK